MSERVRKRRKVIVLAVILILTVLSFYVYTNFNRLVSRAIMRSFNSNVISDVYDFSFDHLNINIVTGDVNIRNVIIRPKENPLQIYPYINSSFILYTKRIDLVHVGIYALLKYNLLKVSRIEIEKPEISVQLKGKYHILFPFKKAVETSDTGVGLLKKYFDSYFLKEFVLRDASLVMVDENKGDSYKIGALNLSLSNIQLSQRAGVDSLSFRKAGLGMSGFVIHSKDGGFKSMESKKYELSVDSFAIQQRPDSVDFQVANYTTRIQDWQLVTADSIYVIGAKSVELSRSEKALHISDLTLKPAIINEKFNQLSKFRKELFTISVKKADFLDISFERLRFERAIFVGQVNLDSADVLIYKDKTKELDLKRFPEYLGQKLNSIGIPLTINKLSISKSALTYQEKQHEGEIAGVNISRLNISAENISNQMPDSKLTIHSKGYLENKIPVDLALAFSYKKPEFSFRGAIKSFEIVDLNPVIEAFAPVSVKKGTVDAINFSGNGYAGEAIGEMEFLYHDLALNIDLKKYSKVKNSLITFAANNYLNSSNPASDSKAARQVRIDVKRDSNKGFMNLIIKSVVSGLQQTMIPSKENRKLNRDTKKALKKELREQKKADKQAISR